MPNPKGINGSSPGKKGSGRGKGKKKGGPTSMNVSSGKHINRVDAAAKMFGTNSKQHLAAQKRFG